MRRAMAILLLTGIVAAGAWASIGRWDKVPVKDHGRANPLAGQAQAYLGTLVGTRPGGH